MKHNTLMKILLSLTVFVLLTTLFGLSAFAMGSNLGDTNGDGVVNGKDATNLLKYCAKWDVTIDETNSDSNCDGKVKGNDVTQLLKYLVSYSYDYINNENFLFVQKDPNKDFKIVNFSDPQVMSDGEFMSMVYAMDEVIEKEQPDLITISGDLSNGWHENLLIYDALGDWWDHYGIPWTYCLGNHDNGASDTLNDIEELYERFENLLYHSTAGQAGMGRSNFVVVIREGFKPVEAVFMMDTHASSTYDGVGSYDKLTATQMEWYEKQVEILKDASCDDSTLVIHIPIYAYNDAVNAAVKDVKEYKKLGVDEVDGSGIWNEGYEDSFGVFHEDYICSHYKDDGVFAILKAHGSTKNVISGHDHINNFSINYEGIRLTYGLKTGNGCYWEKELNGGTVLMVNSDGVYDVYHHYVDLDKIDYTKYN